MRVIIVKTIASVFGKIDKRQDVFFKLNAFFQEILYFRQY
jgi:hypothetical protein